MCKAPVKLDNGQEVACRSCNDCVAAAKNQWVRRAMCEVATSAQTLAITLTYGTDTEEKEDGARAFRYADIRLFMARLRRAIAVEHGETGTLRFICCGETGGKKGRVHWHMLLFSDHDLLTLGEWLSFRNKKPVTTREAKISPLGNSKRAKMLLWQHWPHGAVVVQEPDRAAVSYVIKYAMKEQYNARKARGTMRGSKSDNHGAALFRMSKKPPIGHDWVAQKTAKLLEQRATLATFQLKPEGTTGYWRPTGYIAEMLVKRLAVINQIVQCETGRDAPQFASLLASVGENSKEWEGLNNVTETETEELEEFEQELRFRKKEYLSRKANARTRKRCGNLRPCSACAAGVGPKEFAELEKDYTELVREIAPNKEGPNPEEAERRWRLRRKPSPFCLLKNCASVKGAFAPLA